MATLSPDGGSNVPPPQTQKPGVVADAIWGAASRRMADLRIMVSDDRVALSTLDEICTLLREWRSAAERGALGPGETPSRLASARSARPASARSRLGQGVRPALTPAAYSYALDFAGADGDATTRERDYKSRVSSHASTLTDSVGVWRAVQRAANYTGRAAGRVPGSQRLDNSAAVGFSGVPRVPSLSLDFNNNFDYVKLESPAPHHAGQEVIRVNVRPLSARAPRNAATTKMQRPASARMASRRDAAASLSSSYLQAPTSKQRPSSARSASQRAPMTVRAFEPFQDTAFSSLRVAVPTDVLYESANFHDHLRWLNAATCAELVDAVCRRPHEELAPHATRLQDHLQIFSIVSNTFNSRNELERQHATIEKLHHQSRELMEELRKSENEVLRLREILDTLRRDIPSRGQSIEDDRPEDSDHEADESRTNPVENDRKVDQHVKLITRVSEPTCVQSVSVSSVKSEKEQQEREAAVLAANAVYAQEKGVRQASYSTVDDFYKGLDRFNGMPVAAGEVDFFKTMEQEFCGVEDADVEFETYNYGGLRTTLRQEWEYVVNPAKGKDYPGLIPKLDQNNKPYAKRDGGRVRELKEYLDHHLAKSAGLRKAEVIALRLHTGPVYMHLNGTLRKRASSGAENRFTVTISMVNSAIRKLVRVTPIKSSKLYRGISKMAMPHQFFNRDSKNCRGFVEPGFTSATTDKSVAVHYAGREMPSILEIHTGQVDHGADLTWVSQFPGEKEMLILPLSNFEIIGMRRESDINIYECGLNLNLNSKSLEDLLEARKLSVLDFGQCLWNEARLVFFSNAGFIDLLPNVISEQAFLGSVKDKDQEYFHDVQQFYLSMTDLFHRWREMMHEGAKCLKVRAERMLRILAEEMLETKEDQDAVESQSTLSIVQTSLTSKDIKHAKELLTTAERALEVSTSIAAGFGGDLSALNQAMLDDLQCELLPTVIELEAGEDKTALATALMKKTSRMLQRRSDDQDEFQEVVDQLVNAFAVRSEAFCTNKVNQKQANKLLATLLELGKGNISSLDLASWVWTNDAFFTARTAAEKKKEVSANLEMLRQMHKFGLRSLEDAVSYLKKEDLSRMNLDSRREDILNNELDAVRQKMGQKKTKQDNPSLPHRMSMDEWLKKKQDEERAKKKKASMKAAGPKQNVIRLSDDLAKFRESEAGQLFRESRDQS